MARRETVLEDSNDLLLDTLCNTFGGILLLSLLLALLTEESKVRIVTDTQQKLIEARGAIASEKLSSARVVEQNLLKELEEFSRPGHAAVSDKRKRLSDELHKIRDETVAVNAVLAEFRDHGAKDMAQRIKEVQALQAVAEAELGPALKAEKDRKNEIEYLTKRREELAIALSDEKQGERKSLRLPREQTIDRDALRLNVIVRYGELFPLWYFGEFGRMDNTESLTWTNLSADRREAKPIQGKGWNVETPGGKQRLLSQIGRMGKGSVVALFVYPDSFDYFLNAKEIILDADRSYALDVVMPSEPLRWASEGYVPPAQ